MPYITCPDGKTYSRYDQSPYVKWCIQNEKDKYKTCTLDPKCKAARDRHFNNAMQALGGLCVILIILLLLTLVFKRNK